MYKQSSSGLSEDDCCRSGYYTHSGLRGPVEYDTSLNDERVFASRISVFSRGSLCFRKPRKFCVVSEPAPAVVI